MDSVDSWSQVTGLTVLTENHQSCDKTRSREIFVVILSHCLRISIGKEGLRAKYFFRQIFHTNLGASAWGR